MNAGSIPIVIPTYESHFNYITQYHNQSDHDNPDTLFFPDYAQNIFA